ncbi:MAG TPA: LytTR family DNA-binding domain-containing protein, partial [Flavisolibacter sp.]|nr:LytTR family DNA-binding domain-containing protein [Flavisolibacter sp.]
NIKIVVVDDEFQSRNLLVKLIRHYHEDIEIVGEAATIAEAIQIIESKKPSLIFLDIALTNETGFDLLDQFSSIDFEVIFTTAHQNFAARAFRYNALDYLLKPIDLDHLNTALDKAAKVITENQRPEKKLETLLKAIQLNEANQQLNKVAIPTSEGFIFIPLNEILYCHAISNYTNIQLTNKKSITSSYTLKQYDELLKDKNFFRVHKSFLVNLEHIQKYKRSGTLLMSDGLEIEVSRFLKESFVKTFKNRFPSWS